MKQEHDVFTVDMLPPVVVDKRPRGRPRKPGGALTRAQVQKAYRDRQEAAGRSSLTIDLPIELWAALDKFVLFKDESKSGVIERVLRQHLLRKR